METATDNRVDIEIPDIELDKCQEQYTHFHSHHPPQLHHNYACAGGRMKMKIN